MRFRPANIRLINRRPNLPRLLLALSLNNDKSKDNYKNNYTDAQGLTGHSISDSHPIVSCRACETNHAWLRGNVLRHRERASCDMVYVP